MGRASTTRGAVTVVPVWNFHSLPRGLPMSVRMRMPEACLPSKRTRSTMVSSLRVPPSSTNLSIRGSLMPAMPRLGTAAVRTRFDLIRATLAMNRHSPADWELASGMVVMIMVMFSHSSRKVGGRFMWSSHWVTERLSQAAKSGSSMAAICIIRPMKEFFSSSFSWMNSFMSTLLLSTRRSRVLVQEPHSISTPTLAAIS